MITKRSQENDAGSHERTDEGAAGAPVLFEIHLCGEAKKKVAPDRGSWLDGEAGETGFRHGGTVLWL